MSKYKALYYHYEFRTKQDEKWSKQDILDEFNREMTLDAYDSEIFEDEERARKSIKKYIDQHLVKPYKRRTNIGWVILGEVVELIETEDGDIISSELFTKGE